MLITNLPCKTLYSAVLVCNQWFRINKRGFKLSGNTALFRSFVILDKFVSSSSAIIFPFQSFSNARMSNEPQALSTRQATVLATGRKL
jgi:hypothetical protein